MYKSSYQCHLSKSFILVLCAVTSLKTSQSMSLLLKWFKRKWEPSRQGLLGLELSLQCLSLCTISPSLSLLQPKALVNLTFPFLLSYSVHIVLFSSLPFKTLTKLLAEAQALTLSLWFYWIFSSAINTVIYLIIFGAHTLIVILFNKYLAHR